MNRELLLLLLIVPLMPAMEMPSFLPMVLSEHPRSQRRRPQVHAFESRDKFFSFRAWRASYRVDRSVCRYIVNAIRTCALLAPSQSQTIGSRAVSQEKLVAIWLYCMGAPVPLERAASYFEASLTTIVRAMRVVPIAILEMLGDNIASCERRI